MHTFKYKEIILYVAITMCMLGWMWYAEESEDISCSSAFTVIGKNEQVSLSVTFYMKNKNGLMTFTGSSTNGKDDISIKIYFSYDTAGENIYVLKNSSSDIRLPSFNTDNEFNTLLPPFITGNQTSDNLIIKIIKIKEGTWAFMSTNTPYFICEGAETR